MTSMTTYKPHWIREDFIDFVGEKSIQPGHSKSQSIGREYSGGQPRLFKIQLRPNYNFNRGSFQAGQNIAVTLRLDGVRHQRHYSIVTILKMAM